MTKEERLSVLKKWKEKSAADRSRYEYQWSKNLKLMKGIWQEDEPLKSNVRKKNRIFYRKIWASSWRLLASFWAALLRDQKVFEIVPRGMGMEYLGGDDTKKSRLLHFMTEYRLDWMKRTQNLFIQHLWALMDIITFGVSWGKFSWDSDKDGPRYDVYPPEQVYPDFAGALQSKMRYIIYESYMSKEDMEERGYKNLDKLNPGSVSPSQLRAVRHRDNVDPLGNVGDNEYPSPGTVGDGEKETAGAPYKVNEGFYFVDGKPIMAVWADEDNGDTYLLDPEDSPFGKEFPDVMGLCLVEPHVMFGEGFPSPQAGPQESYNQTLNLRKDNQQLAMNSPTIVDRYANVDMQSLVNRRPGGVVTADNAVNSVHQLEVRDVTQTAYMEAAADEAMMQEMSGVTSTLEGRAGNVKATVANINQSEGSAKMDLYTAIVAETYFKNFIYKLAYMIKTFETDEKLFRVANAKWAEEQKQMFYFEEYDLDIDVDCSINVGLGNVGRQQEIQQTLLAMDRAIMSNQSTIQLMSSGAVPTGTKMRLVNLSAFTEDLLPILGKRDLDRYFITLPTMPAQGGQDPGLSGKATPQMGEMAPENQFQAGGMGGI